MKHMLIILGLISSAIASAETTSLKDCQSMFPHNKIPVVNQKTREFCFSEFAILFSPETKNAIYSVQRLDAARLNKKVKRNNRFHADQFVPASERALPSDYKNTGLDKGHFSEAAAMSTDLAAYESVDLLNVSAQSSRFNRGIWAKSVELATRKYILRNPSHSVIVYTGPWYNPDHGTLGRVHFFKPDYYYKLVFDETTGKSWCHFLENRDDVRMKAPITYQEFVAKTGLHLLD
jgi:endonuclease G